MAPDAARAVCVKNQAVFASKRQWQEGGHGEASKNFTKKTHINAFIYHQYAFLLNVLDFPTPYSELSTIFYQA